MRKPQGMTMNYSMVTNEDGSQEIGFRYNDTDGVKVDKHYEGEQDDDIFSHLLKDVMKDISVQSAQIRKEKERKALAEKEAEKARKVAAAKKAPAQSYEEIIEDLRQKLKKIEEENKSLKIDNDILNKRVKDNIHQEVKKKEQKRVEEKYNPYKILEDLFNDIDTDKTDDLWDILFK